MSIHELDQMFGSTPQNILNTPLKMWQYRESEIKKESPAPEFPRKKDLRL